MGTPRRILVTGAGGFVGGHLVPVLRAAYPGAELHTGPFDVTDAEAAAEAILAAAPDAVVHLAAMAVPALAAKDPGRTRAVNVDGTLNVARAVMRHAPGATLLFASSADCYGVSFNAGPVDESTPLAPRGAYAESKAAADLALGELAAEGLRAVRARPFNHTGPGQSADLVAPAFARQVARIEAGLQAPVIEVGDLSPRRDFLDVRDVCAAYARCLGADLPPGQVVNIGSGTARRIEDILRALLAQAGVAAEIRIDPARFRPTDVPVAEGDAGFARRVLGWAPAIPWEKTLADVLDDWRKRVAVAE